MELCKLTKTKLQLSLSCNIHIIVFLILDLLQFKQTCLYTVWRQKSINATTKGIIIVYYMKLCNDIYVMKRKGRHASCYTVESINIITF